MAWLGVVGAGHAAIPTSERAVLIALYANTNGASWDNRTNWNGAAGTECTWFGVTCSTGNANVVALSLPGNGLIGTLPTTLNQLTALREFHAYGNQLNGAIPSLAGLAALQSFDVGVNQLTGVIPSLNGLTALRYFFVGSNRLTGTIPSLAGLTALQDFHTNNNQLTGTIPSLAGRTTLRFFYVDNNQLTGTIPSLTGLTALQVFHVNKNQLSGTIPPLTGLIALREFNVHSNRLTGAIPSLAGLTLNTARSQLCPNGLTLSIDPAWDAATYGETWDVGCSQVLLLSPPATLHKAGHATFSASVLVGTPASIAPIRFSSLSPEVCTINATTGEAIVLPNPPSPFCNIAADKAGDASVNSAAQQAVSKRISALSGDCRLDVNGDGELEADIDGLLILRSLNGFRGSSLIAGLTLTGTRTSAPAIESFLAVQDFRVRDTPPGVASTSDGLVLYRYLLQLIDSSLVAGSELVGSDPDVARTRFARWCTP